jgi:hypothetical protein
VPLRWQRFSLPVRQYQPAVALSSMHATTATVTVHGLVHTSPVPTSTMTQTHRHGPCGQRPCSMPSPPTCRRARFTLQIHPARQPLSHTRSCTRTPPCCGAVRSCPCPVGRPVSAALPSRIRTSAFTQTPAARRAPPADQRPPRRFAKSARVAPRMEAPAPNLPQVPIAKPSP